MPHEIVQPGRLSRPGRLVAAWAALVLLVCCSQAPSRSHEGEGGEAPAAAAESAGQEALPAVKNFAVYALSRGGGVPQEARDVLRRIEALVDADREGGAQVTVETTRIGLEGESRFCATYEDPVVAAATYRRAAEIAEGVDLLNLVAEPCPSR
jgi:hypothetical protein